jgi:pimeloyl-ACP methyl ester carboxylesterase
VTESLESAASAAPEADNLRRVSFDVPGGVMAGIAFGAKTPNPDIVFLHATGFNARAYRLLLEPLGDKFHVLALDARGHGRTQLKARTFGYASWRRHRNDVINLLERHFTQPVTLAGHSMGATVALMVAGRRPDLVNSLALFEPVILPALAYAVCELPFGPLLNRALHPLARKASERRRRFPSREAAVSAFANRGVFKSFTREMIADYVGDGFIETPSGAVKLACHPRYEAATYCAQRNHPWAALEAGSGPLVLLRAEKHSTVSPAAMQRVAAMRPGARVATVEGASHMLPMERPDRVRAAIEAAALMAPRRFQDVE